MRPTARAVGDLPPSPPSSLLGLIGEYGEASDLVVVLEDAGTLHLVRGSERVRLRPPGTGDVWRVAGDPLRSVRFDRDRSGRARAVVVDGRSLARIDVGALAEQRIRAGVRADPEALRRRALAASPPVETGKRDSDLVALRHLDPSIRLDIRYATTNNFMGIRLYDRPGAYLQRPAAEAVARVSAALRPLGYGLVIHDAYRPWFVTWMFWEATPPENHNFVANPATGSRHNRGAAVDLSLYDLRNGREVQMPSRYDEFSGRALPTYPGGTARQRWLRDLLRRAMEAEGFTVYSDEWWHFDYEGWRDWPIGNRPFGALERPPRH
ncbi:MAG: M15 family metallopeptidase [Caulobacteraceae bacterium]|nr:M15 family metallopeptidase [Caulobacteraceae bacterium]